MNDTARITWQYGDPAVEWPSRGSNGLARRAALRTLENSSHTATPVVSYQSGNSLLVIGNDSSLAASVVDRFEETDLNLSLLIADPSLDHPAGSKLREVDAVYGSVHDLSGFLGDFRVSIDDNDEPVDLSSALGREKDHFDLILDLCDSPILQREVPPPGYLAPRTQKELAAAVEILPEMRGEFDKPRYFQYDPDICAHVSSRQIGCTRCLDACPTEAISSLEEMIAVDPYLCQGGGVCASACPSGAITYQFPQVSDLLRSLRRSLRRYREEGGQKPVLLFHDDDLGLDAMTKVADKLPENVLPIRLEEIGSAGLDAWLAGLCYGASAIGLMMPADLPESVRTELQHQLGIGKALLTALGIDQGRLQAIDADDDAWWRGKPWLAKDAMDPPAAFEAFEDKRTTIQLALQHLYENAAERPRRTRLPVGSPFGEIRIDDQACTLCMGCVAVCPSSALADGGSHPAVKFNEGNCVQCGICEKACPEDAITLMPSYCFDADERRRSRVLNEEQPFFCAKCGKPFATRSMMDKIDMKLSGHWMYQDPRQRARLKMCEHCRVEDLFSDGKGLDPHAKPGL